MYLARCLPWSLRVNAKLAHANAVYRTMPSLVTSGSRKRTGRFMTWYDGRLSYATQLLNALYYEPWWPFIPLSPK